MTLEENWINSSHFIVDSLEQHKFALGPAKFDHCEGVRQFVRYADPDAFTLSALLVRIDVVEASIRAA